MKYRSSIILSLVLLGIWSCSDYGVSCPDGLDCAGECGGLLVNDECGVCGGDGYNDGGCCGDDSNCLNYIDIQSNIFNNTSFRVKQFILNYELTWLNPVFDIVFSTDLFFVYAHYCKLKLALRDILSPLDKKGATK